MPSSFAEAVRTADDVLGGSPVLQRFGYATCRRDLSGETPALPAMCQFTLQPSGCRSLTISFCYSPRGTHFFTVEVFNPPAGASFLVEEWLKYHGVVLDPYPFILSSYSGTERERLGGFVSFLERQISDAGLHRVLSGESWVDIPCDWGATK